MFLKYSSDCSGVRTECWEIRVGLGIYSHPDDNIVPSSGDSDVTYENQSDFIYYLKVEPRWFMDIRQIGKKRAKDEAHTLGLSNKKEGLGIHQGRSLHGTKL